MAPSDWLKTQSYDRIINNVSINGFRPTFNQRECVSCLVHMPTKFKVLLTNKSKSGYKCIQCAELSSIKMFRGIKSEILTSIVEKNRFLSNTYFELRIRPANTLCAKMAETKTNYANDRLAKVKEKRTFHRQIQGKRVYTCMILNMLGHIFTNQMSLPIIRNMEKDDRTRALNTPRD